MFFKLLLLLLVAVVALSAPGLQKIVQNKQKSQVSEIFQKSKQLKFSVRDVRTVAGRIPRAIVRSVKASAKSFVTSSAMLIPVGLVLNVGQLRPVDAWLLKGVTTGVEWAKVGAYFVGAEVLIANLRNKDDRNNAYLGSGITSGLLRIKEGPVGMVQGFVIGYGFMYAIDKFAVHDPKKSAQSMSASKLSASLRDLKSSLAPVTMKSTSVMQRVGAILPVSTL